MEAIIDSEYLTNVISFHAQQACEKSLKAVIEEFELGFIRTHDLGRLLTIIKDFISFDIDVELIRKLDRLYTDARYPSDFGLLPNGKPSIREAKEFAEFAKMVYEKIYGFLLKKSQQLVTN